MSSPSFSSTAERTSRPEGWGRGSTARTRPETDACTVALRPSASPIFWPRRTVSPGFTRGVQGFPICWSMGMTTWAGRGARDRGTSRESSLRPSGWTPPQNRCLMDSPLCQDQFLTQELGTDQIRKAGAVAALAGGIHPHGLRAPAVENGLSLLLGKGEQGGGERVRQTGVGADDGHRAPIGAVSGGQ